MEAKDATAGGGGDVKRPAVNVDAKQRKWLVNCWLDWAQGRWIL
jgi:hypothetical protein